MTGLKRIILSRFIRKAKDLSDDEILSLYHSVKEKLDAQKKSEDQVLDGDGFGKAPQEEENESLVKPTTEQAPQTEQAEGDGQADKEIDDLLDSLGLGDTEDTGEEEKTATALPPETPPPVSPIAPTSKPAEPVTPPPVADISEVPVVNQPVEAPASMPIGVNQVEVEETPPPALPPVEEPSTTEQPPITPGLPEEDEDEALFSRLTNKIVSDPQFDIKNFKTATRGLQVCRKDKDIMADDVSKPKYTEPEIKPPRMDVRDPNGVRYKKNEKDRDADIDSDPDLK